jgi:hypothetical protein
VILLPQELVDAVVQVAYRVLPESGILDLAHPLAYLPYELLPEMLGIG